MGSYSLLCRDDKGEQHDWKVALAERAQIWVTEKGVSECHLYVGIIKGFWIYVY